MPNGTCCILGHRTIKVTDSIVSELTNTIESLIINNGVTTFLFGSKSQFNDLCYDLVTGAKARYPHIKRIYIRAEFPVIDNDYKTYLLKRYEDTVFPEKLINAGRSVYVQRNYEMIDRSQYCLMYYDKSSKPQSRKSGTEIAYNYALKKNKMICLFPNHRTGDGSTSC